MADTPLARESVEFTTKGIELVQAGFAKVKAGLDQVSAATKDVAAKVAATPAAIGLAVAGFNQLAAAARGWVNAGLAGTGTGNLLAAQFTLLSQQIAGVFVPLIQQVTRAVTALSEWFRHLTGDQQRMIRLFVEAAAVMGIVHATLGRVTFAIVGFVASVVGGMVAAAGSILTTLIPAFMTLVTAVSEGGAVMAASLGFATAGISTILGIVAVAVSALVSLGLAGATVGAGLVVGTEAGRGALVSLWEALKPVIEGFRRIGTQLATAFAPILDRLGAQAGQVLGKIAAGVQALAGPLVSVFAAVLPVVAAVASWGLSIVGWLVDAGTAVVRWLESWVTIRGVLATVGGVLAVLAGYVVATLGPAFIAIGAAIGVIVVALAPFVSAALAIGAALAAVGYVIGRVVVALMPLWEVMYAVGVAVFQVQMAIAGALLSAVVSLFGPVASVGDMFEVWMAWLRQVATFMAVGIVGAVNTMIQALARFTELLASAAAGLDAVFGTNLEARLTTLAARLRGIRVEIGGPAAPPGAPAREGRPRTDVEMAGGQFGKAEDMFRRIQEAAIKTQAEDRQAARDAKQLGVLEEIRDRLPGQAGERRPVRARPTKDAADVGGGDW